MRDIISWKEKLAKDLEKYIPNGNIKPKRFLDIELSLYLMNKLFFRKCPEEGWTLLVGYEFNHPLYMSLSDREKQAIANARFYLQFYKTRFLYEEYLKFYFQCPEAIRLYDKDKATGRLIKLDTSVLSNRGKVYQKVLNTCPVHKNEDIIWAQGGKNYFDCENRVEEVDIPESWMGVKISNKKTLNLVNKKERITFKITMKELISTAEYMDSILENGFYKNTVKRLSFMNVKNKSFIEEETEFEVNGLSHMVGMVSAGKSTLMKILAVYCARNNLHITLVLDSIASIYDMLNILEKLNIKAAPLWGISNKEEHIKKLENYSNEENLEDIEGNELHKWVSNICPLDGLRNDNTVNKTFKAGKQPCSKLRSDRDSKKNITCPYYYKCPLNYSFMSLVDASVYLATPASFIHSWIPTQLYPYKMRLSEVIYRKSDLIIFDEADRVQINFDSYFAPSEILLDTTGTSWMNKLGINVANSYYGSGRVQLEDKAVKNWFDEYNRTQSTLNIIRSILLDSPKLFNWIKGRYFSANRLINIFAVGLEYKNKVLEILEGFRKDPLDKNNSKEENIFSSLVQILIAYDENTAIDKKLIKWCKKFCIPIEECTVGKLKLIMLVAVLEWGLKVIVDKWDAAEEAFGLNVENMPFFTNHLKDYSSIIPEAPTGNIFGFRYSSNKNGEPEKLHVVRTMGVGRWIIMNFHNYLLKSEGIYGPNTILLSGTSWAPGSMNYNIDVMPTTILKGKDDELRAIEKSQFFFTPGEFNGKPISISGYQDEKRIANLEKLLKYLITPNMSQRSRGKSIIDYELDILEDKRKSILLLVGSYAEVSIVKEYLDKNLASQKGWKSEDIIRLVRDDEEFNDDNSISRGSVNKFALMNAKILIAPLLAIERGHNILNEDNVAAIGSAFFLIRPMPVPEDMNSNIYYINEWAIKKMKNANWINSLEEEINFGNVIKGFRKDAIRKFEGRLCESGKLTYRSMKLEDRNKLCWTQLVVIWQVIGRLVRGGKSARVHFCDAKFAPKSSKGELDSSSTSLLVGMREALHKYFDNSSGNEQISEREIAKQLYGPLYKALSNIKGVEYNEK